MHTGWFVYICSLLLLPCHAMRDYYSIENNKVVQTCAYVSNSDSFVQRWFRVRDPYIAISSPEKEKWETEFGVYSLVMGGEDMQKVTIGLNPYFKVCDEIALMQGYCEHESDESNSKKSSLADLIDSGLFSYPIESFMFNNKDEDHVYELDKSGIYCIMFLGSDIPEAAEGFTLEVSWVQSFGNLLISDYYRMFISTDFAIVYLLVAMILSYLTYRKIGKSQTATAIDKLQYKKYTLQYKFILFYWCYGILYLFTVIHYLLLNKYDYFSGSFVLPLVNFLTLSLSTITTVWLIYNLMLFSSGIWFTGCKTSNSKIYLTRAVSIILIVEMTLYDFEASAIYSLIGDNKIDFLSTVIYIEYVLIFFVCLIWSILTSFSITEKKLKNTFYITIILLSFLFSVLIFGAHTLSATATSSALAYVFEFIFTLVITMLWFNVVLENNQFQFKL